MTSSPDLAALLVRVEAAEGADRELDEQIAMRLAGFKPTIRLGHEVLGNLRDVPAHSPRYTESLDSALALCERLNCSPKLMLLGALASMEKFELSRLPLAIIAMLLRGLIEDA